MLIARNLFVPVVLLAQITVLQEGAKSNADFINKFKIVEEEVDESLYFLEMLVEFNKEKRDKIAILYKEGEELLKIIVSSLKTLRKK